MSALSQISLASSDGTHSNSAEPASPPLPYIMLHMNGSRKFCQRGSNFDNFFFFIFCVIQIPLKAGHHWPASETPFKWRFAGVPMMPQH